MKQELIDIIERIKRDPNLLLSVFDVQNFKPIINSWSYERICQKYQSIEGFFNSIVQDGIEQILVEERKKHGTSTVAVGQKKSFTLKMKGTEHQTCNIQAQNPDVSPANALIPIGLQAMQGNIGLGFSQIVDLHVSAADKVRLDTENKYLKEKCERLEKENQELKEERLQNKFSEKKADGNKELLLGFLENLPVLLGKEPSKIPAVGLSAPSTPDLSEQKQVLFDNLTQTSPEVDSYMLLILNGIYENETFYHDLTSLLKKYQLIKE